MTLSMSGTILVAAALAVPPATGRQDVALKDLMPRVFEGADAKPADRDTLPTHAAFDGVVDALRNAR